jgi:Ca-activated chloride channel family protein
MRPALAVLLLVLAPALFAQVPAEAGAGALYFRTSPVSIEPATMLATDVDIDLTGIVARVSVSQSFRNNGREWVEGIYVFPLPDDAAVDRLTMRIGERRIAGEIQPREKAKQIYERARAAGQHASLVEQERPNLFTTSVANIAPGQEIVIEIAYLQTVTYDQGRFSLRFPMTLTPRFVPGIPLGTARGEGWSFDTNQVPDASRITSPVLDPGGPLENLASIQATLDAGVALAELASPSHDLRTARVGERHTLTLAADRVAMDRDFVLEWRPVPGDAPRAIAFTEAFDNESYVLLMFLPPAAAALAQVAPREIVFVIDTSGSMGGSSIAQAKSALQTALARLTSNDRFNVIEFNSATRSLYPAPVQLNAQTLAAATRFVDRLQADGGTHMEPAIRAALAQPQRDGYLRQVVFVTDGSVGNEAALFATIRRELGDARFFTVGIGAAPNSHFMRKAAQFGRGGFVHIAHPEDVAPRMQGLFDKLEHVALTDIQLDWPDVVEAYPRRVPDLYLGEPVVVAARIDHVIFEPLTIESSGRVGRLAWSQRIGIAPGRSTGVATLWGRRKIESLLDSKLEGASEDSIRDSVVEVALRHDLVSPHTSLVAVDKTPQRSREALLQRAALANMLPAGAEFGAIFGRLPNTATDAPFARLAGTVLTALLLGLICIRRMVRQ